MKINELTKQQLAEVFSECGGRINALAQHFGVSDATARKTLIDRGIINNPLASDIKDLLEQGLSQKEAAARLGVAASTVAKNAPYERPCYLNENKSRSAIKSKYYRDKKNGKEE